MFIYFLKLFLKPSLFFLAALGLRCGSPASLVVALELSRLRACGILVP